MPDRLPFTSSFTCSEFISTLQFSHCHFHQDFIAAFCKPLSWISDIPLGVCTSVSLPFACVMTGCKPKPRTGALHHLGLTLPHKQRTRKLVHSRRNTVIVAVIDHDCNTSSILSNFANLFGRKSHWELSLKPRSF